MSHFTVEQGDLAAICKLIGQRDLLPRDGAVYLGLLSFMNPIDHRVRVRARIIAGRLGMQEQHVISSISRLCKAGYLVRHMGLDGGPVLLLLSPAGRVFPSCLEDAL